MTDEQSGRKNKSISILRNEGITILASLPVIEGEHETVRRETREVAERAFALCIVATKGEGAPQPMINQIIDHYRPAFSPAEQSFIDDPDPSEHTRIQFCWQYECYWVMLWALGFVEELGYPNTVCDVPRAVTLMRDLGRDGFISAASLRSQNQILDEADLMFRRHWAVRDARVNPESSTETGDMDHGIVLERHRALNWLIGYGKNWDEVSTDT